MRRITELSQITEEDIKNKMVYILNVGDLNAITYAIKTTLVIDGELSAYDGLLDGFK